MVFFCCGACGESLKKNQVEKHYMTKCRQCNMLSCVDCGKEFWGDSYQQHIKCISEDEKYGGKDYKPKPGSNKGEVKQELWIQQVQRAIQSASGNPKLQSVLSLLESYSNIPRKKAKFENFVRNSLKVRDNYLITQVWNIMEGAAQKPEEQKKPAETTEKVVPEKVEENEINKENTTEEKKSKREKKEERRQKLNKKEKKDKSKNDETSKSKDEASAIVNEDVGDNSEKGKKKKKKRKRDESESDETPSGTTSEENQTSKKKKSTDSNDLSMCRLNETLDPETVESSSGKFDWEQTICIVLKGAGGEISLKKLRKKVLSQYMATGKAHGKSEEKIWSKFEKKLNKSVLFKVHKERVKFSK